MSFLTKPIEGNFRNIYTLPFRRAYSSVGRAPVLHTGGHRFESCCAQAFLYAGVVQLVRAPACQAGSCGFKSRLSRYLFILCCGLLAIGCSSHSLEDCREEGEAITRTLIYEFSQIHNREDLLKASAKIKRLFNDLVSIIVAAHAAQHQEVIELTPYNHLLSDQLRTEINRVYRIEGAREVVEKFQEEALHRLDAYEKLHHKR